MFSNLRKKNVEDYVKVSSVEVYLLRKFIIIETGTVDFLEMTMKCDMAH